MYDVIIVGAGPAGLFAAYELITKNKNLKVAILDRGNAVKTRICPMNKMGIPCQNCNPCNILSGYGGAGTFSDGKLNTLVKDKCVKETKQTDEKDAEENPESYNCDKYEGYTVVGNKCVKPKCDICTKEAEQEEVKVCSDGYDLVNDKCKKTVNEEVEITYYRYSTRSCNGGSTSVKWSENYNDSSLLNNGYKRTGNKRVLVITK